jgi:hypothetical protein
MDPLTWRDVFVGLGVLASVLLWFGSRAWELWLEQRRLRADTDAFIRAIFAEIDFNTWDMTRFLKATVPLERLRELLEQRAFIPHITDARHTEVYRSRIKELHAVVGKGPSDDRLVGDIVRFYGELEKVTQQIEGLNRLSFRTISVAGKVGTIGTIYRTCETCEFLGKVILAQMEVRFAHLRLQRSDSALAADGEDLQGLKHRLEKLQSDLDRVNQALGHRNSPSER